MSGHCIAADAEMLRALHIPGDPLLLANIWDSATSADFVTSAAEAAQNCV